MITARPKLMLKLIQANHQGYFDAVQLIYADQLNPDHQLKAANYFLHHYLQSNELILSGKIRTPQLFWLRHSCGSIDDHVERLTDT